MRLSFLSVFIGALIVLAPFVNASATSENTSETIVRTVKSKPQTKIYFAHGEYSTVSAPTWCSKDVQYDETENYTEQEYQTVQEYVCDAAGKCEWQSNSKWVDVQKTRTVTKTRSESYVCGYHDEEVFDHWWKQAVEVNILPGADLKPDEKEKIVIGLAGYEGHPSVEVDSSAAIFNYEISSEKMKGKTLVIELVAKPFITPIMAGAASIVKVGANFLASSIDIVVNDKVKNVRVETVISAKIHLKGGTDVLGEAQGKVRKGANWHIVIAGDFDPAKEYTVDLSVARSGVTMTEPVSFVLSKDVKSEKLDIDQLKDSDLLFGFSAKGVKDTSTIVFQDNTVDYKIVRTQYAVRLSARLKGDWKLLAEKVFDRSALLQDPPESGRLNIDLKTAFGVKDTDLAKLTSGTKLKIEMVAKRTSPGLKDMKIKKSVQVTVPKQGPMNQK